MNLAPSSSKYLPWQARKDAGRRLIYPEWSVRYQAILGIDGRTRLHAGISGRECVGHLIRVMYDVMLQQHPLTDT